MHILRKLPGEDPILGEDPTLEEQNPAPEHLIHPTSDLPTAKGTLIGNSAFGKTITNNLKHTTGQILNDKETKQQINILLLESIVVCVCVCAGRYLRIHNEKFSQFLPPSVLCECVLPKIINFLIACIVM